jgi:hypothetical protein
MGDAETCRPRAVASSMRIVASSTVDANGFWE